MGSDIVGIDHLMLSVRNSADAAAVFARMGFSTTPRGQLPGMSNRLICFANPHKNVPNFVEMMSLDDPSLAPPSMAEALKTPDQPVLLVAASDNAQSTHARLVQNGLDVAPVIDGGRDWTLPDGEVIDLAFSIVLPTPGPAPFYWIACEHNTPQHYLRDGFTTHENTSTELSKIIAMAQDPADAAKHYQKHWSASVSAPETGPVTVSCGRVEFQIHSPKTFSETFPTIELTRKEDHIVGFAARVANMEKVKEILDKNGFSPQNNAEALLLSPAQCCGCLVLFEAQ